MVVVYTPQISSRIVYVCKQVFEQFLGVPYRLEQVRPAGHSGDFVIYYTEETGECDLRILPSGWLHETTIRTSLPEIKGTGRDVSLFPNASEHFGFDVFSAVFWLLARYEEYGTFTPDNHQRFPATASLAYQNGFILIPVIDHWMQSLRQLINRKKNGLVPEPVFHIINTIDVDNAYAYKGKGFIRQTGALFKHALKAQVGELGQRLKVLRGKAADPYDNYAYIRETAERYGVKTIFFHLVGELSDHDRNISIAHPAYAALINQLKTWSVQGLHPSYRSNTHPALITAEKKQLEKVTGYNIGHARQHFLRLSFPHTYRHLIQAGIRQDFSMGFADHAGFRAGTGRAFYFFDLQANEETPLLVQPLCIMEGTLKDYMHLSVSEATRLIGQVRDELRSLGSTYVAVWHNETLGDHKGWKGWRGVYESQFGR